MTKINVLYEITHNVEGSSFTFLIISDNLEQAVQESFKLAADKVGERFKTRTMSGEYLSLIKVTRNVKVFLNRIKTHNEETKVTCPECGHSWGAKVEGYVTCFKCSKSFSPKE